MRIPAPHVIEQIERQRREREQDHRVPLHIPLPPPGWEPERRQSNDQGEKSDRGVFIFQM